MCWIVCFTIHPYIMASRFRLCRDSYFQVTNHQWAYLLKLDTWQDILIDWSLTFNSISLSVMWGSIFSIYRRSKIKDRYPTLFVALLKLYYLSFDNIFGFWNFNDRVKGHKGESDLNLDNYSDCVVCSSSYYIYNI